MPIILGWLLGVLLCVGKKRFQSTVVKAVNKNKRESRLTKALLQITPTCTIYIDWKPVSNVNDFKHQGKEWGKYHGSFLQIRIKQMIRGEWRKTQGYSLPQQFHCSVCIFSDDSRFYRFKGGTWCTEQHNSKKRHGKPWYFNINVILLDAFFKFVSYWLKPMKA